MLWSLFKSLLAWPAGALRARRARRCFEQGLACKDRQDFEGAHRYFEQAVAHDPGHAYAHHWLGILCAREPGRYTDSIRHLERALKLDPRIPDAWIDLGSVHYMARDLPRAIACFRAATETHPESVLAHSNLGLTLKEAGRRDEALAPLRRAFELAPEGSNTLRNLVVTLIEAERCEEALSVTSRAVERNPGSYDVQVLHAFACQKVHQPERALAHYAIARGMRAPDAEFYDNRGVALQHLGKVHEALEDYARALALEPDFRLARFHQATARLMIGDFEGGWPGYELRRDSSEFKARSWNLPEWDGSPLSGRALRIYGEQGLGDEIMFASLYPEVIAVARKCVLECHPKLLALFARSFPGASVSAYPPDTSSPPAPTVADLDWESPSGSLPRFLRPNREAFPAHSGYLKADPGRVAYWKERLTRLGDGLKVGISWSGGVHRTRQPVRSLPLGEWGPILKVPGVRFISLQYTESASQEAGEASGRHGVAIAHWPEAIEDYDETAALVCALDLVISVCTAVIHLGGALGRPVWVMTPYSPEWRYGFTGQGMVWYPTVRLFRQPAYGQWDAVVTSVAAGLRALAGPTGAEKTRGAGAGGDP